MNDGRQRHQARVAVVSFLRHGDDVLLLRHAASSDRFAGRWNGIGGHVEVGENILAAARRELFEEAGVKDATLRLRGVCHETGLVGQPYLTFFFVGDAPIRSFDSREGHEMAWQPLHALPDLPLVSDVAELLPRLLQAGEPLFITETYDGSDGLLELRIEDSHAG